MLPDLVSLVRHTLLGLGHQGKGHRAVGDDLTVHTGTALQLPHAAPEPLDVRFDHDDITGKRWSAEADPLDAGEHDELLAVGRLGQNQDGAHLGDGLGENGRWQRGLFTHAL